LLKAVKNPVELANMENVILKDSAAVTRFIYWLKKNIGKGTLYFGAFADYTPTAKRLAISKSVLSAIGENTATLKCLNTNISFVRRTAPDGKCIIDLLNVNTNSSISEPFVLKFKNGKSIKGKLKPCHIKKIEI